MEKHSIVKRIFWSGSKILPLLIVLILVIVLFTAIRPQYVASADNVRGMLNAMSLTGTLAVGVACLLIGGGMDLSVGSVGMLAGIIVAFLIEAGMPWVYAMIITLLMGAAIGAFNAFLVEGLGFMGFIATIGVSTMLTGLGNVITNAKIVTIGNKSFFNLGSTTFLGLFSLPFVIMIVLMVGYGILLTRTRFGRKVYMCGGNRFAAQMVGLKPKKTRTILHINCSTLAALGGVILAARMRSGSPTAVVGQEFDAITASVLGGVSFMGGGGSLAGCFIGLAILKCFQNGLTFVGVDAYWTVVAQGALLIAALVVDFMNTRTLRNRMKAG